MKTGDQSLDFISQFLSKSTVIGSNEYHRLDLDKSIFKFIGGFVEPYFLYELIVTSEKYKQLSHIEKDRVISFEEEYDSKGNVASLSKVGNEHTDAFRAVLASQFIYLYEQSEEI